MTACSFLITGGSMKLSMSFFFAVSLEEERKTTKGVCAACLNLIGGLCKGLLFGDCTEFLTN